MIEKNEEDDMNKELLKDGLIKYIAGVILVGALLFIPAVSLKW